MENRQNSGNRAPRIKISPSGPFPRGISLLRVQQKSIMQCSVEGAYQSLGGTGGLGLLRSGDLPASRSSPLSQYCRTVSLDP